MKKVTMYCMGGKFLTEIEDFLNDVFSHRKEHYPMCKTETKDVMIMLKALFKAYGYDFYMMTIDLSPLMCDDGVKIYVHLTSLDDVIDNDLTSKNKKALCQEIHRLIDIIGMPTNIVSIEDTYCAVWTRNFVRWF